MAIREIVFDTETTGLDPNNGHKIIEIGALELIDRIPTGRSFHQFINPEREVDPGAAAVHGITNDMLEGKPLFADVVDGWIEFIADSALVAHNASFDMGFLNAELTLLSRDGHTNEVVDTLAIARKMFPGARHTLDALCTRFEIDNSNRTYHGALLDAQLLADVYLELTGGRQHGLALGAVGNNSAAAKAKRAAPKTLREARDFPLNPAEVELHQQFVAKIKDNLWGVE